jgi:hypothetical protein
MASKKDEKMVDLMAVMLVDLMAVMRDLRVDLMAARTGLCLVDLRVDLKVRNLVDS